MFTIINRFTVQGKIDRLENGIVRATELLRRQPDFDFMVRVRPVRRTNVVVQLGYWTSYAGFARAVRQPAFAEQIEKISALIDETQADHAVSVVRVIERQSCHLHRDAYGILTEYTVTDDQPTFERNFLEHARSCLNHVGFGGVDLLRLTLRPCRYLGMSWWFDAALADAPGSRGAPDVGQLILAHADRIEHTGRITFERALASG